MSKQWPSSQFCFCWIFNVGRGSSAFVRTPSNHGILVDCGYEGDPILPHIEVEILPHLKDAGEERKIAQSVLSHPHLDHIRDIDRLMKLNPSLHTCPNDKDPIDGWPDERVNWDLVDNAEDEEDLIGKYRAAYKERSLPLRVFDFGDVVSNFAYSLFYIRPPVSEDRLPKADYTNNLSVFSQIQYGGSNLFIGGDIMASGMKHVLAEGSEVRVTGDGIHTDAADRTSDRVLFRKWAKAGYSIFVAPHHGLKSAYSQELFDHLRDNNATIKLNVISEKSNTGDGQGDIHPAYQKKSDVVQGRSVLLRVETDDGEWDIKSEERCSLTTRSDGHVLVAMYRTAKPKVVACKDLTWILRHGPDFLLQA